MSWELLPVNYTDAVWSGLKRYNTITNEDGTVSFQDVTAYSNKEKSFFGARDANRMNEALNTLMSMVENGSDLYEAFQNYFTTQKGLFENEADSKQDGFTAYITALEAEGDNVINSLKPIIARKWTPLRVSNRHYSRLGSSSSRVSSEKMLPEIYKIRLLLSTPKRTVLTRAQLLSLPMERPSRKSTRQETRKSKPCSLPIQLSRKSSIRKSQTEVIPS